MKILEWLGGHDVGSSSKTIALTALGEMPKQPSYPHDSDDFGRCFRLLILCPDAKIGLERLGKDGGDVWKALVARWTEIEAAYLDDNKIDVEGDDRGQQQNAPRYCYLTCQI